MEQEHESSIWGGPGDKKGIHRNYTGLSGGPCSGIRNGLHRIAVQRPIQFSSSGLQSIYEGRDGVCW